MTTTNTVNVPRCKPSRTNDPLYWNQFSESNVIKAGSTRIDYIDFSPRYSFQEPHNFAVSSDYIKIYNPKALDSSSFLCESIRNAYGGTFDKVGRYFTCGDQEGHVRLCKWSSERVEWSMCNLEKKHTAAVHRTFFTVNQSHIASFSDDRTVRLWDLSNGNCVNTFEQAHTDNIRAGCVSPVWPNNLLSGGYDGTAKMWDIRTNSIVFEVDHGFPIESVMFLPTSGLFASCGGPRVTIWDVFAGGKLLTTLPDRVRNITCLQMACNGSRLLSGGWDQEVHIFDMTTFRIVHSLHFLHKICSVAVTPDEEMLAFGMSDGNIVFLHKDFDRKIEMPQKTAIPKFILKPDQTLQHYRKIPEPELQEMIRKQEYSEALRTVFTTDCLNNTPESTFRVLHELKRLQCMDHALKDQSNEFLNKFVSFLIRHIGDQRFIRLLIYISNILLDVYEDNISGLGSDVKIKLVKLSKKLEDEDNVMAEVEELDGAIELLISGANVVDKQLTNFQFK
ncbi:U3 small nucleolar RNA-associated protein 15 homolog [Bradysia coprophila]|uniref:U3 small nucleolar RNA-associated protein 15 homolog n=1 Tax=Bradysia coprophila TaxID=38358 RepID=UPI00187DCE36|nr:U3 small nucleolar RNA-associated protein 15 homolog [Bradysia coprophila]